MENDERERHSLVLFFSSLSEKERMKEGQRERERERKVTDKQIDSERYRRKS